MMDRCGAAAEAEIDDTSKGLVLSIWRQQMRALLDDLGWQAEDIAIRSYDGGATLMISAPRDALYAAASMIEQVWADVCAVIAGQQPEDPVCADAISTMIARQSNPAEVALEAAANSRGVTYLGNDQLVSVGLGRGSKTWQADQIPSTDDIDWNTVHDVPIAMVTGTNGKSTTVRLAAAIGKAAGRTVGLSSSDWVRVGDEIVDEGDYSGPAGARLAVRDTRVDMAVIETARGGLMRRGMPVPSADACLITNVAADHLGEYGINDVRALADAKFLLAKAVKPQGRLILNGDDQELVERGVRFDGKITWYGLNFDDGLLERWIESGGHAAFIANGHMMLACDGTRSRIMPVADFAPGMGGAARYNLSNALAAIALASALDLPVEAMTRGLSGFKGTPEENPGRGNIIEVGGLTLMIDFAHNTHGVAAVVDAIKTLPAKRRLFLAGHAGDRSDHDVRELTRAIWQGEPDMVVVKELPDKLRGRTLGELSEIFVDELKQLGASQDQMQLATNEYDAVHKALTWARPGDFLVLLLHDKREPTMNLLQKLTDTGWQAGEALPA